MDRRRAPYAVLMLASLTASGAVGGCISDPDCGVCDPEQLVLESISGVNYARDKVHLLGPGVEEFDYFVDRVGPCLESEEAQASERGAEEYCKLSPLVTSQGVEFLFNNLLEPSSVEGLRQSPEDPAQVEIYAWKHQLARIEGPITRFNGDYVPGPGGGGRVTRAINLSCIDNLRAMGVDFDHELLEQNPDICDGFQLHGGRKLPLEMQVEGTTKSFAGETDWRGRSCESPLPGQVDTCCSVCDYELSVNVAKYGVDEGGGRRGPDSAIACTPGGDVYQDCAGFSPFVERGAEPARYSYAWDGAVELHKVPLFDKLRETHPSARPPEHLRSGPACSIDADCEASLGEDAGAACIGQLPGGQACAPGQPGCANTRCQPEWFVGCADSAGTGSPRCVDRRFEDVGAGACFVATAEFSSCDPNTGSCTTWPAGSRLARCDSGEFPDGVLEASECCQVELGTSVDDWDCDPLFQSGVRPLSRFDRDPELPAKTRDCYCGDPELQAPACADQIERLCTAPWGELERHDGTSNAEHYLTRFVTRVGGVVYDPALKGVLYLPADQGNQRRALVESCAEGRIGRPTSQDGWRMHDRGEHESYEDFDRAMCSASSYRVVFAREGQHVRDKAGNRVDDGVSYRFETAEFHVVPDSGFPPDSMRIGPCESFELRVSNKYGLDPRNLAKIAIVQLARTAGEDEGGESCATSLSAQCWQEQQVVAGGPGCSDDPAAVGPDTPPCLDIDVSAQAEGVIGLGLDTGRFAPALLPADESDDRFGRPRTGRYRVRLPGLDQVEHFADLELENPEDLAAYLAAFHDVCGMPLIASGGRGYTDAFYDFTIDPSSCKDDPDLDGVSMSCDNAPEHWNPTQRDQDGDGVGDRADACPLTPELSASTASDSDRDGVGDACDRCAQSPSSFNLDASLPADPRLWVRNVPAQGDFDRDGVGDVCDNCVSVANCSAYDGDNPHLLGDPLPGVPSESCLADLDQDMIGDACIDPDTLTGVFDLEHAAGPVGFEASDDFDQDGIVNLEDLCPRQPLAADYDARRSCTSDADCLAGSSCAATPAAQGERYCNHGDSDGDGVGDLCDTCPFHANPMQVTDGGMQEDDNDGDFVGLACEVGAECSLRRSPRPFTFMEVSVAGQCCTSTYPGDGAYVQRDDGTWGCEGLCDPDGFPITRACENEADPGEDQPDGELCRRLPESVASMPGVVELPPGCEQALAAAGLCDANDPGCAEQQANRSLTLLDYPDENELWGKMCSLPPLDQDFDGLGDTCELCPFAYDPSNRSVDLGPTVDPGVFGYYCSGDYSPENSCDEQSMGGEESGG